MTLFRGRIKQINGEQFVEVIQPPEDGILNARALVPLGAVPADPKALQNFHFVDGKAYPAQGQVTGLAVNAAKSVPAACEPTEPWAWQREALDRWDKAGKKGIIEAVTGSGKTFLAMEAWRQVTERHRDTYTLVVVPSVTLQEQWFARLQKRFPGQRIARLGNGHNQSFANGKICVAIVNSVVGVGRAEDDAKLHSLFDHCRRSADNRSFLIADECHHDIDAEVFQRVRTLIRFDHVLALSATVGERFDVEGLGKIVYSYTFADAVKRGDLPPLTLLNVRCSLDADEERRYDEFTKNIRDQAAFLSRLFPELEADGFEDSFWATLKRLDRGEGPDGHPAIRKLMVLFFKRSSLLYQAREKQSAAQTLLRTLLDSGRKKLIVFFERIQTAENGIAGVELETAEGLRRDIASSTLWTGILHSEVPGNDRQGVLDRFRAAECGVLFACRMLDEGFDVPDVDGAVLVASTKSKRQRIQRVGRVLRRGDGKKQPVVITLMCARTTDEFVATDDRSLFGQTTTIVTGYVGGASDWLRKNPRRG